MKIRLSFSKKSRTFSFGQHKSSQTMLICMRFLSSLQSGAFLSQCGQFV